MRDRAPARIAVRLETNHIDVSSWRLLSVRHVNSGNVPVNPSQESSTRPTPSGDRSLNKYGGAGLLASSAKRGWSNLTAELRGHSGTVIWSNPQPDAEICVDVRGSRSVVTRRLDGVTDSTVSERGTIWFRPAGVQEGLIDMSEPMPAILHLYLSPSRFTPDNLSKGFDRTAIRSLRHEGGFHDPLLAEIAYAIMSELEHETSAGRLLAETLALSLMARLVQNHADASSSSVVTPAARKGLEPRR